MEQLDVSSYPSLKRVAPPPPAKSAGYLNEYRARARMLLAVDEMVEASGSVVVG